MNTQKILVIDYNGTNNEHRIYDKLDNTLFKKVIDFKKNNPNNTQLKEITSEPPGIFLSQPYHFKKKTINNLKKDIYEIIILAYDYFTNIKGNKNVKNYNPEIFIKALENEQKKTKNELDQNENYTDIENALENTLNRIKSKKTKITLIKSKY